MKAFFLRRVSRGQLILPQTDMDGNWTSVLVTLVCGASAVCVLVRWRRKQKTAEKIRQARRRREQSFLLAKQAVERFKVEDPSFESGSIVSLSLAELVEKLKDESLQPETVLHAFLEKAVEVNDNLNCGTEIIIDSLAHVKDIGSGEKGLLYGVPISIKDNFSYKGLDSTCGVVCKISQPAEEDSVVVSVLKRQGAIPFIKTNVPQGLLNYDCSNPIFGQTLNPCNLHKTPGGSSGGEGALVGAGGSVLGLGTDIAGSVRIPAAFCGVCGFKPTSKRISSQGLGSCAKGQKSVLTSLGPLARDVESLALCMRALLCRDMFSLDPTVPPIPFNLEVYESSRPLRIGYYEEDGYLQPSPGMSRALRETKDLLEKAGHTLVPFKPLRLYDCIHELIVKGILADGAETLLSHLDEGPVDPCLKPQVLPYRCPDLLKRFLSFILRPIYPRMSACINAVRGMESISELWRHHAKIEEYVHETIGEWQRLQLDALLCPMLGPAYNFFYCGRLSSALSYTGLYNLLNFPAGVVPVSRVTEEDEHQLRFYTGAHRDLWDRLFVKAVKDGVGLPLAVQCVSLPWQDEMCLRLMREVEQLTARKRLTENRPL